MKNFSNILLIIFLTVIVSCKTRQKLVYFQNNTEKISGQEFNFSFQKDDIISISVSCADPELAKPFNFNNAQLKSESQDGYKTGFSHEGYLIDENGYINFPVIGKIKLGGLNRSQAQDLMITELKKYINDPIVFIRLTNFKATILGSVTNPGIYSIPNEKFTIIDLISLASDLKITGTRNNILLIREENNIRKEYRMDLTSKNLFESPAFYLKQNDIVYVEPNSQERLASTFFKNSGIVIVSSLTLILTAINIFLLN